MESGTYTAQILTFPAVACRRPGTEFEGWRSIGQLVNELRLIRLAPIAAQSEESGQAPVFVMEPARPPRFYEWLEGLRGRKIK